MPKDPNLVKRWDFNKETINRMRQHMEMVPAKCNTCNRMFWSYDGRLPTHFASDQSDLACPGSYQPINGKAQNGMDVGNN